jgi:hypothetical protein
MALGDLSGQGKPTIKNVGIGHNNNKAPIIALILALESPRLALYGGKATKPFKFQSSFDRALK